MESNNKTVQPDKFCEAHAVTSIESPMLHAFINWAPQPQFVNVFRPRGMSHVIERRRSPNKFDGGYSQNESHKNVIVLFRQMKGLDVMPNCFTFPVILKSCVKINALKEGEEVHCFVIKSGFRANPFVATTLIDMNVIAWTAMINGYITCCDLVTARRLFDLSPERDIVLWNTMISGYIEAKDVIRARELFDKMPNKDVMSWNTVLNGYASNGDVMACERLFEEMPERNVFSWNALFGGYTRNGCFSEVLSAFKRMLVDGTV
ncbi:hypothetical protein D5086_016477, partial [Populus alba]